MFFLFGPTQKREEQESIEISGAERVEEGLYVRVQAQSGKQGSGSGARQAPGQVSAFVEGKTEEVRSDPSPTTGEADSGEETDNVDAPSSTAPGRTAL